MGLAIQEDNVKFLTDWTKTDWVDYLLHTLAGLGITLAVVLPLALTGQKTWIVAVAGVGSVLVNFLVGWIRENVQHSWQPLTPHQWREALTWPLGGLLGLIPGLLV